MEKRLLYHASSIIADLGAIAASGYVTGLGQLSKSVESYGLER
jgi:hypothetical protein